MESTQLIISAVILVFAIVSFSMQKIPISLTAMIAMTAMYLFGCIDSKTILGNIGNSNVLMIAAMSVVSAGMARTQFIKNVAKTCYQLSHGSLRLILAGYCITATLLAQCLGSSLVVLTILIPLMTASAKEMNISVSKLVFPVALCAIGSVSSLPIGTGAALYAKMNTYLEGAGSAYRMTVLQPMICRLPGLLVILFWCIFISPKVTPDRTINQPKEITAKAEDDRPPLKPFQEKAGMVIFLASTLGLIFNSKLHIDAYMIAIAGACLMQLLGVLNAKEVVKAVPVNTIMLLAGTLCLAQGLANTGAATMIGDFLASICLKIGNQFLIATFIFLVPYIATQFMENRGVIAVFCPIIAMLTKSLDCNPIGILNLVYAGSLSSFLTPMASTAMPAMMEWGDYDVKTVIKMAWLPSLVLAVVSIVWTIIAYPLW